MIKKLAVVSLCTLSLAACDSSEVGDVSLGVFTTQDIKLNNLTDPDVQVSLIELLVKDF